MSEHRRTVGVLFMLAVCLALGAGRGREAQTSSTQEPPAESPPEVQEYRVGPGDVLQLFVWKEPDISRDLTVRFDGKVTVPLLGDVTAGGRTPSQLGSEITRLLARFLAAPQVTVGVGHANSARFYVLGQVAKPGDFPLTGRTTLLQALAIAGGFREFAKTDSIVIVRQDRGLVVPKGRPAEQVIQVSYKRLEAGRDLSENLVLRPGDTILVP